MQRIVLTFGLIGGALLAAMMLATVPFQDQIGFDRGAIVGYTTMVLAFLMVYFGVRSYREVVGGGVVTFGRAFQVGLLISLVITVCYVATWQVLYYGFVPDFLDSYYGLRAREGPPCRRERGRSHPPGERAPRFRGHGTATRS
jgi:hypothetical protein